MKKFEAIYVNLSGLAVLIFGVMFFVYQAFFVPIEVTYELNEMHDAEGKPRVIFKPSEPIFMARRICKDKDVAGFVDRELLNVQTQAVYPLSRYQSGAFVGCELRTIAIPLPANLPEGEYLFKSRAIYQINSFRSFATTAPPIPFEIRK